MSRQSGQFPARKSDSESSDRVNAQGSPALPAPRSPGNATNNGSVRANDPGAVSTSEGTRRGEASQAVLAARPSANIRTTRGQADPDAPSSSQASTRTGEAPRRRRRDSVHRPYRFDVLDDPTSYFNYLERSRTPPGRPSRVTPAPDPDASGTWRREQVERFGRHVEHDFKVKVRRYSPEPAAPPAIVRRNTPLQAPSPAVVRSSNANNGGQPSPSTATVRRNSPQPTSSTATVRSPNSSVGGAGYGNAARWFLGTMARQPSPTEVQASERTSESDLMEAIEALSQSFDQLQFPTPEAEFQQDLADIEEQMQHMDVAAEVAAIQPVVEVAVIPPAIRAAPIPSNPNSTFNSAIFASQQNVSANSALSAPSTLAPFQEDSREQAMMNDDSEVDAMEEDPAPQPSPISPIRSEEPLGSKIEDEKEEKEDHMEAEASVPESSSNGTVKEPVEVAGNASESDEDMEDADDQPSVKSRKEEANVQPASKADEVVEKPKTGESLIAEQKIDDNPSTSNANRNPKMPPIRPNPELARRFQKVKVQKLADKLAAAKAKKKRLLSRRSKGPISQLSAIVVEATSIATTNAPVSAAEDVPKSSDKGQADGHSQANCEAVSHSLDTTEAAVQPESEAVEVVGEARSDESVIAQQKIDNIPSSSNAKVASKTPNATTNEPIGAVEDVSKPDEGPAKHPHASLDTTEAASQPGSEAVEVVGEAKTDESAATEQTADDIPPHQSNPISQQSAIVVEATPIATTNEPVDTAHAVTESEAAEVAREIQTDETVVVKPTPTKPNAELARRFQDKVEKLADDVAAAKARKDRPRQVDTPIDEANGTENGLRIDQGGESRSMEEGALPEEAPVAVEESTASVAENVESTESEIKSIEPVSEADGNESPSTVNQQSQNADSRVSEESASGADSAEVSEEDVETALFDSFVGGTQPESDYMFALAPHLKRRCQELLDQIAAAKAKKQPTASAASPPRQPYYVTDPNLLAKCRKLSKAVAAAWAKRRGLSPPADSDDNCVPSSSTDTQPRRPLQGNMSDVKARVQEKYRKHLADLAAARARRRLPPQQDEAKAKRRRVNQVEEPVPSALTGEGEAVEQAEMQRKEPVSEAGGNGSPSTLTQQSQNVDSKVSEDRTEEKKAADEAMEVAEKDNEIAESVEGVNAGSEPANLNASEPEEAVLPEASASKANESASQMRPQSQEVPPKESNRVEEGVDEVQEAAPSDIVVAETVESVTPESQSINADSNKNEEKDKDKTPSEEVRQKTDSQRKKRQRSTQSQVPEKKKKAIRQTPNTSPTDAINGHSSTEATSADPEGEMEVEPVSQVEEVPVSGEVDNRTEVVVKEVDVESPTQAETSNIAKGVEQSSSTEVQATEPEINVIIPRQTQSGSDNKQRIDNSAASTKTQSVDRGNDESKTEDLTKSDEESVKKDKKVAENVKVALPSLSVDVTNTSHSPVEAAPSNSTSTAAQPTEATVSSSSEQPIEDRLNDAFGDGFNATMRPRMLLTERTLAKVIERQQTHPIPRRRTPSTQEQPPLSANDESIARRLQERKECEEAASVADHDATDVPSSSDVTVPQPGPSTVSPSTQSMPTQSRDSFEVPTRRSQLLTVKLLKKIIERDAKNPPPKRSPSPIKLTPSSANDESNARRQRERDECDAKSSSEEEVSGTANESIETEPICDEADASANGGQMEGRKSAENNAREAQHEPEDAASISSMNTADFENANSLNDEVIAAPDAAIAQVIPPQQNDAIEDEQGDVIFDEDPYNHDFPAMDDHDPPSDQDARSRSSNSSGSDVFVQRPAASSKRRRRIVSDSSNSDGEPPLRRLRHDQSMGPNDMETDHDQWCELCYRGCPCPRVPRPNNRRRNGPIDHADSDESDESDTESVRPRRARRRKPMSLEEEWKQLRYVLDLEMTNLPAAPPKFNRYFDMLEGLPLTTDRLKKVIFRDTFQVALYTDGEVVFQGSFPGVNSSDDLLKQALLRPVLMYHEPEQPVDDIEVGDNFIVMLTRGGYLLSVGGNDQGQLGASANPERYRQRAITPASMRRFAVPKPGHVGEVFFNDIAVVEKTTVATATTGHTYVCGEGFDPQLTWDGVELPR